MPMLQNIYFYQNMDMGLYTGVVFLDLKKAFDTVDHTILINKLRKYCWGPNAILWFIDYLSGRTQKCSVNGIKSGACSVTCGIPQGSILGPLLFILYINDLPDYLDVANVNLYADDTAMLVSSRSQVDLMLMLRMELHTVSEWLRASKLTLNMEKTKNCIFATRPKLQNFGAYS